MYNPTQPVQYQPCFIPPLQPTNHGMYFNSQVQPYSIPQSYSMPQQYIPVPTNRGFRPHIGMGQPSNVPYIMHQDYIPVANSGYPHSVGGIPPIQPQTRPVTYEMPPVQQAQFVPQFPKPPRHVSSFVQNRAGVVNQQTYYEPKQTSPSYNISCEGGEEPKIPEKLEEQCEIPVQSSPEEELSELNKPKTDDAGMISITHERVPTPVPPQLLDDVQSTEGDVVHSPSEITLVPSPLSSDGMQTVCSSPVFSDNEEEVLTATEDDQIPTKDTGSPSEYALTCSSIERVEPEHPYDNESSKPSNQEQHIYGSIEICNSDTMTGNSSQPHQRSIRSLIDTPVYNTSHSRVLCQLSQSSGSSAQHCNGIRKRPLTTHFRQLFKPIPSSTKTEDKSS